MKPLHVCSLLLWLAYVPVCLAQEAVVSGSVFDQHDARLAGANISLKGTYEGVSADSLGNFVFHTETLGPQTLLVSLVGYQTAELPVVIQPTAPATLTVRLREAANELNTVTVSGSSFIISDAKRMVLMKPLDILTTPGANADIVAALQTLPGTTKVGETEGLFVRGGAGTETRTFLDDALVANPFYSGGPDVAQRSRFSSAGLLFKGTSFGKGGFSAQYGQALSAMVALETQDTDPMPGTTFALNTGGVALTSAKETGKFSYWQNTYYTNMALLFQLIPQNINWQRAPEYLGTNFLLRYRPNSRSILKLYGMLSGNRSALSWRDTARLDPQLARYQIGNTYYMGSVNYRATFGADNGWVLKALGSYSNNVDDLNLTGTLAGRSDELWQGKVVVSRSLGELSSLLVGTETQHYAYTNRYAQFNRAIAYQYVATFAEADWFLTNRLAMKAGLRYEYTSLNRQASVSPRFTLAYKTGPYSQISGSAGRFLQLPNNLYLISNPTLNTEQAWHLMANYERTHNKRSLRIELYQKQYAQLVTERVAAYDANPYRYPTAATTNGGFGYARGLDVFVKDAQSLKNLEWWVSYSLIDTRRLFANYLAEAVPTFVSKHNANVVVKYTVPGANLTIGANYVWASGRPYYSPTFQAYETPAFNSMSLNASYLTRLWGRFTVLYASADNVLGIRNVYSYRFTADGSQPVPVIPGAYRSVFAGLSVNLSNKSK